MHDFRKVYPPVIVSIGYQIYVAGPGLSNIDQPYTIIFHPSTGLCVLKKSLIEPLELGPCNESQAWAFTAERTIALKDTLFCLKADGTSKPVKLGIICSDSRSKWELTSDSKMHLSTNISSDSSSLCLDVDSDGKTIVTNPCKCLSKDHSCDPESQWFKMVNSTRPIINKNSQNYNNSKQEHGRFSGISSSSFPRE